MKSIDAHGIDTQTRGTTMTTAFTLQIDAWNDGEEIPARYALGKPGNPMEMSDNINPAITWRNAPEGTKSYVVLVTDPDVPSVGDDVNTEGREVPADLPRVDFYHWVLIDLPASVTAIAEGAASNGITPGGKPTGESLGGVAGANDYTGWFAGDPDMGGTYGGYDGPCPPWNDSIIHHYHFEVFALDVESLAVGEDNLTGSAVREAMRGHVLASDRHVGTYSLNPAVLEVR